MLEAMTNRVLTCQMISKERMTMSPEEYEKLEKKIESVKDDLWDAIEEDRCGDEMLSNEMEQLREWNEKLEKDYERLDRKLAGMESHLEFLEKTLAKWKFGVWIILVLVILFLLSSFGWSRLAGILLSLFNWFLSIFGLLIESSA
jgi:FtsZ-binding cell division protein ZapB